MLTDIACEYTLTFYYNKSNLKWFTNQWRVQDLTLGGDFVNRGGGVEHVEG